jgi:hypothetical protein
VICLAPRAREDSVRPRRLAGVVARPLNFTVRSRPDRALIQDAWIQRAVTSPIRQTIQKDGRIRRWCQVPEMDNRYLRVILLPDGETIHNAFFDRDFAP